jgi:transcriptional regulator with XRE-family HTH domain
MPHTPEPLSAEHRFMDRVREIREARGLSQARLAQAMTARGFSLHQTSIAKMEAPDVEERRPLRLSEALALAEILEEDLGDMLRGPLRQNAKRNEELRQAVNEAEAELARARDAYDRHLMRQFAPQYR